MLMEWAIGKGYDLYRPDTGKLLLPGSQISWDVHIHAVGEEIRDNVELGKRILAESGLAIQPAENMADGAQKIVAAISK